MISIGLCRTYAVSRLQNKLFKMFSAKHSYEDAMYKLNSLQSNKATIDQILKDIKGGRRSTNIKDMENYLLRIGITLSKLDQLSVIHVAGTKGKGSTSAMCESILRHNGYTTGFYSSPHLVVVRERIRLNGRVVSEAKFARHFHQVYDMLDASKAYDGDMPKYFAFLTVMAFNMFLEEKVDVAIVEVGIGGLLDGTNVLRKVPVVGITALGLDHTSILGNTLAQIAAAKAGIMKPGCEAYTVRQPTEAMEVLPKVAQSVKCTLSVVPDYNSYTFLNGYRSKLQADLEAYQSNASLAIQLAHSWMRLAKLTNHRLSNIEEKSIISGKLILQRGFEDLDGPPHVKCDKYEVCEGMITQIPEETGIGLEKCRWPGRYQVVDATYAKFYLDGAHTKESLDICAKWFSDSTINQTTKILIFSATGNRNSELLLNPLKNVLFSHAYFVIPTAYKGINKNSDNYSAVEHKDLLAKCHKNSETWKQLHSSPCEDKITILGSVSEALISIKNNSYTQKPSVLITGSLHLVGATLSIVDPNLSSI